MTIPIPTIDDFDTSTVMTTMREVVDYLIRMVPQINSGDITDLQTSYTKNILTITLVKGDGTTISKNVTIQGGSGTESPYPTDIALSLSGTTLNFNMAMSNGTTITGSVNLATFATDAEVQGIKSDLQEQITNLKLSSTNNNMTLNGDSVQIVKSVSGTVSDGNLKITVNGIQSGDIPLPEIGGTLVTFPVHNISSVTIGDLSTKWYTGDTNTILDSNYIFCNEITTTPIRNGGSATYKRITLNITQANSVADWFNEDVKVLTPRIQTYPKTTYTAYVKVVLQEGTPNTFYTQWSCDIEIKNGVLTIEFEKPGTGEFSVWLSALTSLEQNTTTPATFQLVGFTERPTGV